MNWFSRNCMPIHRHRSLQSSITRPCPPPGCGNIRNEHFSGISAVFLFIDLLAQSDPCTTLVYTTRWRQTFRIIWDPQRYPWEDIIHVITESVAESNSESRLFWLTVNVDSNSRELKAQIFRTVGHPVPSLLLQTLVDGCQRNAYFRVFPAPAAS